jgi:predicted DNA-binding ribbon-helix-helix protein
MSSQEGSHPVTRPAEADKEAAAYGALISRNVTAGKQRTSMRMEPVMWDALDEICWRERMSAGQIIKLIDGKRGRSGRTSAVRAFILSYFWAASTEAGHAAAGHGSVSGFGAKHAELASSALKQNI